MNLVGYVRVSTEEQARDGHGLGQQRDRLAAYCALHGHRLVEVIADEGVSASVPLSKRAGGAVLLERLKGAAHGVVVMRLDRLFRDAYDGLLFFRSAERTRSTVHSVSELIDSSTPAGKLALTIQLAAAQYERDLAVQRATECNAALRMQGRVYGHVPYGCVAVGEGDDRRQLRDPATWPLREAMVRDIRAGLSLREVRSQLAERGVRSPTGKTHWSPNTLRELIVHHDTLATLPLATDDQLAESTHRTRDPEVSTHA